MPALTPHYASVLHGRQGRGQVGTLQAGAVTRLSVASFQTVLFQSLSSLSSPVLLLLCMVMPLVQNRPWNQNAPGKGNRFSWFFAFYISVANCRKALRLGLQVGAPPSTHTQRHTHRHTNHHHDECISCYPTLWYYTKPWLKDLVKIVEQTVQYFLASWHGGSVSCSKAAASLRHEANPSWRVIILSPPVLT